MVQIKQCSFWRWIELQREFVSSIWNYSRWVTYGIVALEIVYGISNAQYRTKEIRNTWRSRNVVTRIFEWSDGILGV